MAPCYSGLYAYHCLDKQWVCLRPDFTEGPYPDPLLPRMAHSMVLDNVSSYAIPLPHIDHTSFFLQEEQKLYIIGGQRKHQLR